MDAVAERKSNRRFRNEPNPGHPSGMPQTARSLLTMGGVWGFYIGYSLFLAFAMAELDHWTSQLE